MENAKVNEKKESVTEVKENSTEVKENSTEVKGSVKVFLERKKYTSSDGRDFWNYYVGGKIRNRDVEIDFMPKDKGGYEPLDIIFDVVDKAELLLSEEKMTSDDGKTTNYITYKASVKDADGVTYECNVKPSRDSDKALFNMLLNTLHIVVGGK